MTGKLTPEEEVVKILEAWQDTGTDVSRSVQRRIAAQKGEPAPDFSNPESLIEIADKGRLESKL